MHLINCMTTNNKKKTFYIEITKLCNLKCPFCPSSNHKSNLQMSFDTFLNVFNKIKNDASLIYFHVLGEPTLHPMFKEILKYVNSQKVMMAVTTNGTNLKVFDEEIIKLPYLNKVNISLQCLVDFNDDKKRNYLDSLFEFLTRKNIFNPKLPINLRLWNNKELSKVEKLNNEVMIAINEWLSKELCQNIRFSCADEFEWPDDQKDITVSTNCLGGKKQLAILCDGTVCLCCLDYLGKTKIGNLFIEELGDIYEKELYQKAISGFCNRKPYFEICKKCSYRSRFN